MGQFIVFANQKGGVGKTTTTANLGAYLSELGKRVLLVDFDPQGNLSSSVSADRKLPDVYALLTGRAVLADVIQRVPALSHLSIISASVDLAGATVELVNQPDRDTYLRRALAPIRADFDYVLIDCPPSLGILTLNGLVAADKVFIPLQCEYFALEGLTQLVHNIKRVQSTSNPNLELGGILFTMYDSRTRLAQEVVQQVVGHFGKRVFRTIIPRNVRLSEAPSHGKPINLYDATCIGAKSYQKLAEEVIERE